MSDSELAANAATSDRNKSAKADKFKTFRAWQVLLWQFLEAGKNTVLNSLRYVIIAGLFVYLLTAVVLLNDIMAFHDRVASDVGDDARARRAVLMLHKMHENPERYPAGDEELPVGTLAVSLGSLKSTYKDLTRFGQFKMGSLEKGGNPKPVTKDDQEIFERQAQLMVSRAEAFERDLQSNESTVAIKRAIDKFRTDLDQAKEGDWTSAASFQDRLAGLAASFGELRRSVIDAAPEIPAHDQVKTIEKRLNELIFKLARPYEVEALKQDLQRLSDSLNTVVAELAILKGDEEDGEPSEDNQAQEELPAASLHQTGAVEHSSAAINGAVPQPDEEHPVFDDLQKVHDRVGAMSERPATPIDYAADLDRLTTDLQSLRGRLTAYPDFETHRDKITNSIALVNQAKAEPVTRDSVAAYLDELKGLRTDLGEIDKILPIDAVTPELRQKLTIMEDVFESTLREPEQHNVEMPASDKNRDLPDFNQHLSEIENALNRRFPDQFPIATSLVGTFDRLRSDLKLLTALQPREYRAPNGDLEHDDDAQKLFESRMEKMKEELEKAETKLQKQGRVIALANVLEENENETAKTANIKAAGIIQDYDALNRFGWLMMPLSSMGVVSPRSVWAQFGLNPLKLATLTTPSITTIYVLVIGAIGSLIYITKYQLKLVIDGQLLRARPPRPLPWFLFRPIFGVVVALALYFVIRAGQLALGSGGGDEVGTTLNIPILSVLALFAGILSWQALAMIESRGGMWFTGQVRRPLWATGLSNALRTHDRSTAECAEQIGRSTEQVERWLTFRDKVPIELQDRIETWIDMRTDELFGDVKPNDDTAGKPMWAVGLKQALDSYDRQIDAEALVELLREEKRPENIERIKDWIGLKLQVSPATQWRLVDLLDVPHHLLFAPELQNRHVWGTKLRKVIEDRKERAKTLADRLGIGPKQVHDWKELDEQIPPAMQEKMMKVLERSFTELFEAGELAEKDKWFLPANNLASALANAERTKEDFAHRIDVEIERVDRWINDKEPIAKPTRERIIQLLRGDSPNLFQEPPGLPSPDDKANPDTETQEVAGGPAFAERLKKAMRDQGIADATALTALVYRGAPPIARNISRVQRWIDGDDDVPKTKRVALAKALKQHHDALFF